MSFTYATETNGGWAAIDNILAGIGKGADYTASAFFETPQRESIVSETTQRAASDGQTYRQSNPENPSMISTDWWRSIGWVGSPYEDDKAVSVKLDESIELDRSVSMRNDPIGSGVDWVLAHTAKVGTIYDQIKGIFSPGDYVEGKPRAGYPEGRNEQNTNIDVNRGPETQTAGNAFYKQVKGLFNLAFPQESPQPVATERHEISPGAETAARLGIGTLAIVGIALIFLMRR